MDPILPPERNTNAMNLFLNSTGKLTDFKFSDERIKNLLQSSLTVELERKYNEEVKLRKEAEERVAKKDEEVEMMNCLVESYKEEQGRLHLQAQALEQKHKEEFGLRKDLEHELAIEREKVEKVQFRLETIENDHEVMCLKAEMFESKYDKELSLRKETEINLDKERNKWEVTKDVLETCKIEKEYLTSEVRTWQDKYDKELSLKKETEDDLSRAGDSQRSTRIIQPRSKCVARRAKTCYSNNSRAHKKAIGKASTSTIVFLPYYTGKNISLTKIESYASYLLNCIAVKR